MNKFTSRQKLEVGAYIVTLALAVPSYFWAISIGDSPLRDFVINLSATFAGAGFLFFLLNRFFGLDTGSKFGDGEAISAVNFFRPDFEDLRERFRKANSIAINGITLSRTSNTYLNELKDCLARGGNVRIVIVNPQHPALEVAANRFNKHQDAEKIRRECEQTMDNLETLFSPNRREKSVQVRLSNAVPPFGIWLIDADKSNAEIWAEIYSFRGIRDPALHLIPYRDGEWFDYFQEQFEKLWEDALEWKPSQKIS